VTYFILFAIYSLYLKESQEKVIGFKTATITTVVADQTAAVLEFIGYHTDAIQHDKELSVKILIENRYVSRVIEGCNSISIIILFIAFIVAFSGSLKATILYSFFGSLFIYAVNIFRIAFLSVMLYKFPEEQVLLHNIIFPAIIYGLIFLLWVVWVHKFSNFKKNG
jgi:exosortase family protein XrtF